jgi:hypothetical protein
MIAQSDQVLFRIIPGVAAKLLVMDFEILPRSATLTSPPISVEYRKSQLCIGFGNKLDSRIFRKKFDHADVF